MPRAKRLHFVEFGPSIPIVSVSSFEKLALTKEQWEDVWQIVGPSVDRNMNGRRRLPLWKVIAAAYLEGLHHGGALATEQSNDR